MPMRNSVRAVVYYVFFASPKAVVTGFVEAISSRGTLTAVKRHGRAFAH